MKKLPFCKRSLWLLGLLLVLLLTRSSLGTVYYVDCQLISDCPGGNYSIASRDGSGSDGIAYNTIQEAANLVLPGDIVYIRGGDYNHTGSNLIFTQFTRSGTAANPIVFQAYQDETPRMIGWGFIDEDNNSDGEADGPIGSYGERLLWISATANYVHVKGLEITNSNRFGLWVSGDNNLIENCKIHDNWQAGVIIHDDGMNNTFRYLEAYLNRHYPGIVVYKGGATFIYDSLFYLNGKVPNGDPVLPWQDDSQGGGNSDGVIFFKGLNLSYGNNQAAGSEVKRCVSFRNSDGGYDFTLTHSTIDDNISFYNGGRHMDPTGRGPGFKVYHNESINLSFRGNIAYEEGDGFMIHVVQEEEYCYNNTTIRSNRGFLFNQNVTTAYNNLAGWQNPDYNWSFPYGSNNWAKDGSHVPPAFTGNPVLVNYNPTIDTNFPGGLTTAQKLEFIRSQFRTAFSPALTSPLIDNGVIVPGYHCPTADDDPVSPMDPNASGRHWYGLAPDIGAYEFVPPVKGRYVFYNNSTFDGDDPAANASDDAAIATDKTALLPGGTATFANYTSYGKGINGIMLDIPSLPGTPTASDFTFKVGDDDIPSAWPTAPAPSSITVRWGAGAGGSDRITIIWADNAIQKQWLQVTVLATANTGLGAADVFYFGNAIGETGNSPIDANVTPTDEVAVRSNPHTLGINPADVTDAYDFNRDRKVGPTDQVICRNNGTSGPTALQRITVP